MAGHVPSMVVTGDRKYTFDSEEGACETATTSKESSRHANYRSQLGEVVTKNNGTGLIRDLVIGMIARKSEVQRWSDIALVLTVNYASQQFGCVSETTLRAASGNLELLCSGRSMTAKLKLKRIDEMASPG
ncbi:hypothetical protein NPIL_400741 [Nephila pilipes]|uniref:Uncharacterized protein n=1 Tax=Nephila pilipes TaxID=299642 RepID=A0A8X6NSC8_NEPPI|nr:hypothetical protein NPIL_400741 [Nephila pilipes]